MVYGIWYMVLYFVFCILYLVSCNHVILSSCQLPTVFILYFLLCTLYFVICITSLPLGPQPRNFLSVFLKK